jgi:hypothetical protein
VSGPADRHTRLLAQALELVADGTSIERVCGASLQLLGASGAAVVLMSELGGASTIAVAGDGADATFDIEFRLGEGPCHDAFGGDVDVLVPDLARTGPARWPVFSTEALTVGTRAVFALGARVGAIKLGVLYLQRDHAGEWSPSQTADARVLTEVVTALLVEHQAGLSNGENPSDWFSGSSDRAIVHQATGMIAVQLGCDLGSALARLRAYAVTSDLHLDETAGEVVAQRLRFEP